MADEAAYEGDGETGWYEISAVLSDGNEVEHDNGDSLNDWLPHSDPTRM